MRVDEGHHDLGRRSSSACAKNAEAFRKISLARRSSPHAPAPSAEPVLLCSAPDDGRYHARPAGPSGGASPTCTRSSPPLTGSPPTASRADVRGRTPTGPPALRTSGEYFLGLPMDSILPRNGASRKPGAVQCGWSWVPPSGLRPAGWPGWADRTVTGRACSRPLLGHGPSGQLAAIRFAGGR